MKTKTIGIFVAALAAISLNAAPVAVDAQAKGTPLEHYWSFGVGAGRVNEGLRSAWHEHLVRANAECGFRYVRMHDTFNDDMFVYFGDGNYSWQYIDEVYDRMLAEGVRPFMDVLKWLAQGKSREETSIILGIGHETVKTHAKSILQKLEVQNTAGAITRAFELGLLRA